MIYNQINKDIQTKEMFSTDPCVGAHVAIYWINKIFNSTLLSKADSLFPVTKMYVIY